MSWIALVSAGLFEVVSIVLMKKISLSKGIRIFWWSLLMAVTFGISLLLLSYGMREIDMSVAYAVWTGIGAVGGVLVGAIFFGEMLTFAKTCCLFIIIASVIGLRLLG